ncbi:TRAP transporter substrate-binding protein [Cobetia crustatorum]|uniref:TRAP transporter substrate-binding protein n=1 Tax=Cobetia crustatorum TaxID=553385 RepID=UPI000469A62E|nr:TRAP transporter substrate-binding protein [Cobetia crustatorum]
MSIALRLHYWLIGPFLIIGLLTASALHAQTTLSMSSDYGAGTLMGERVKEFSQKVVELSQDKLNVEIRSDIRSVSHLQATRGGVIDIAATLSGALADEIPFFGLSSLPAIAYDLDEAHRLYQTAKPRYRELLKEENQRLLFALPWPPSGLWSKDPIEDGAGLTNQPVRTYDRNTQRVFLNLGAAPQIMTWEELTPLLEGGTIKAALTSAMGGVSAELYRYMPNFTTLNYAMPLNIIHMNADSFNALDKQQQTALLNAAQAVEDTGWASTSAVLAKAHATLQAEGAQLISPPPTELRQDLETASQHVIESWNQKVNYQDRALLTKYLESRPER